jgi:hypothetical protein
VVREVLLVLVVFALAGVVAGFLWYWWWSPAPEGVVFAGEPFFDPDQEFRSTGMFVVIAVPLGLLLSMVLTFWLDRDEVATLFAVLAGACLATVLMAVVGDALGPESAREVAAGRADLEPVAADLRVQPFAPYLALPGSAVVGATSILLSFHNRRLSAEPSGYAPRRT